jgi:hypothetical protein
MCLTPCAGPTGYTRLPLSSSVSGLRSMSNPSEERASDPALPSTTARIVPFQRPQSDLQRAVQERAQELMARDRDRANQRPPAWRRVLIFALASVPVFMTFGAALAFVGALRQFNTAILNSPSPAPAPQVQSGGPPSDSGVVMLQSFPTRAAPPKDADAAVSPQSR